MSSDRFIPTPASTPIAAPTAVQSFARRQVFARAPITTHTPSPPPPPPLPAPCFRCRSSGCPNREHGQPPHAEPASRRAGDAARGAACTSPRSVIWGGPCCISCGNPCAAPIPNRHRNPPCSPVCRLRRTASARSRLASVPPCSTGLALRRVPGDAWRRRSGGSQPRSRQDPGRPRECPGCSPRFPFCWCAPDAMWSSTAFT